MVTAATLKKLFVLIERLSPSGANAASRIVPLTTDPYAQNSKPSSIDASSTSVRIVNASGAIGTSMTIANCIAMRQLIGTSRMLETVS